jgi:hypothetical protein
MPASIIPLIIVLGVGQMAAPCMEPLPPPPMGQAQQNQPQACPPGMVTISKGRWVAQGTLDAQTQKMQLSAGPWQTRGEQCEHCQRTLPTTCVGDYQGSHMIQTESGPTRVHVFRQTHWLAVGA